jgi:hypothetical protein
MDPADLNRVNEVLNHEAEIREVRDPLQA